MAKEAILPIVAGVIGSATVLKLAVESVVSVRPTEVGVRVNRITGKKTPLLDREQREPRNKIIETSVLTGYRLTRINDQGQPESLELSTDEYERIMADRAKRTELFNLFGVSEPGVEGQVIKKEEVRDSQISVIERLEPKPKQGLVWRIPGIEKIYRIPTSLFTSNVSEVGLEVPITFDNKTVMGTPDFMISYRILPGGAHKIIELFPQTADNPRSPIAQFKEAVDELTKSVAFFTTSDRDYHSELVGEDNLRVISHRAKEVFARKIVDRKLADVVELVDVVFQNMDLGDFARAINDIAAQQRQRELLGDKLFEQLRLAETYAKGKATVVVREGAAIPSDVVNAQITKGLIPGGER